MHAPSGYVDLQVNGYADVDFNADDWWRKMWRRVCRRLRDDGVAGILATVITADWTRCAGGWRTSAACTTRTGDRRHDLGHPYRRAVSQRSSRATSARIRREFARPADVDTMKRLLDAAGGLTRIVTLAPERDDGTRVTRMLADQGIRVSAGHCNPSLDELRASIDAGLSLFTHLGNGCPAMLPRHDNIIQRVLSLSDRLYIGFIADGVHVPFVALGNYLRCCG